MDRAWSLLQRDGGTTEPLARERWFDSASTIEHFAAQAELDGRFDEAIGALEQRAQSAEGTLGTAAHLWLGRLCALASTHGRASEALAIAEAQVSAPRDRALIAHARALIHSARRDWAEAIREHRVARALFAESSDDLGQLVCSTSLATTLTTMGLLAEAHDELSGVAAIAAREERGLASMQYDASFARMQAHRGEIDDATSRLSKLRAQSECVRRVQLWPLVHHTLAEIAAWREDFAGARAEYEALSALARGAQSRVHAGFAAYSQAIMELDAQRMTEALALADESIATGRAIEIQTLVDGGTAVRATALAALGRRNEALVAYRAIRAPFNADVQPSFGVGNLALIELWLSQDEPVEDERRRWIDRASTRVALLERRDENGHVFCDSTLSLRLLWRRLMTVATAVGAGVQRARSRRVSWISPDGTQITLARDERVSIAHRPVLSRVLAALVASGSAGASIEQIAAIAWPEDRSSAPSMKARVRVAVATLRQIGLAEAIETVANGYRLRWEFTASARS